MKTYSDIAKEYQEYLRGILIDNHDKHDKEYLAAKDKLAIMQMNAYDLYTNKFICSFCSYISHDKNNQYNFGFYSEKLKEFYQVIYENNVRFKHIWTHFMNAKDIACLHKYVLVYDESYFFIPQKNDNWVIYIEPMAFSKLYKKTTDLYLFQIAAGQAGKNPTDVSYKASFELKNLPTFMEDENSPEHKKAEKEYSDLKECIENYCANGIIKLI